MKTSSNKSVNQSFIVPQWPVPDTIKSLLTTRNGGFSQPPFNSFNLASHVGDSSEHVQLNRKKLNLYLPSKNIWLNQIHGQKIVAYKELAGANKYSHVVDADGVFTSTPNQVCSILTADCLPLLFCSKNGQIIAAIHAGWRGLEKGIIDQTIKKLCKNSNLSPNNFLTWLGPAISKKYFEVGTEVKQEFINKSEDYKIAFTPSILPVLKNNNNKYMADIYKLASINLQHQGITKIYGGNFCSYDDEEQFFSYRRDSITGRMATMIWKVK